MGAILSSAYEIYPGYCMWNETANIISGHDSDIAIALATALNFTFTSKRSPDKKFGGKGADGNYNGLLGVLSRAEADFCSCSMMNTAERSLDFEMSIVITAGKITLNMAKAQKKMTNIWVYLLAFSNRLWYAYVYTAVFLAAFANVLQNGFSLIDGINLTITHFVQRDMLIFQS